MTAALNKRLIKLEGAAVVGSPGQISETDWLWLRIPDGGELSPKLLAARQAANRLHKTLRVTTSVNASPLEFWKLYPLDYLPDAMLEEAIAEVAGEIGLTEFELDALKNTGNGQNAEIRSHDGAN